MNDWWSQISKYKWLTRRVMLMWGVSGVAVAVLIGGVAWPSLKQWWQMRGQEKALQARLAKYKQKYNQLSNIDDQVLQQQINQGLSMLPLYHNAPLIIGLLSELGSEKGVNLSSIVFTPGEVASDSVSLVSAQKTTSRTTKKAAKLPKQLRVDKLAIRFKVSGGLEQVRDFILSLERVRPIIRVQRINMSFDEEGNKQASTSAFRVNLGRNVSAFVKIEFYAAKVPKVMPKIDDPVYVVPADMAERYQRWLKEFRNFNQVSRGVSRPSGVNGGRRKVPFFYENQP